MNKMIAAVAIVAVAVAVGFGVYQSQQGDRAGPMAPAPAADTPAPANGPEVAALPPVNPRLGRRMLGREDAPVTIIEHSSLTCPHCRDFHRDTLPLIKKDYIDTGKVRLIFRDYPIGQLALLAAMIPHCAGPQKYFGFLEVLFRNQDTWANDNDPIEALARVVRLGGMARERVDACLNDQKLFEAIRARAEADSRRAGIDSTPTFEIEGMIVPGAHPFETFRDIIEDALKKKRQD